MNVRADNHLYGQAQLHTPAPPKGTEDNQERLVAGVSALTSKRVPDNSGDGNTTTNANTHIRKDNGSDSGAIKSTGDTYCGGDPEIHKPPALNEKDPNGYLITSVFWCTRQFAIYEAADNQIRIMFPKDYHSAKNLRHKIGDLGGLRASIEDLRAEPSISSLERTRAAREVSWALAQALEDESDPPSSQPKDILTRVDARLRSLVKSHYRKKYVLSNVVAFCAIEIALVLAAVIFSRVFIQPGNLDALHRYALYGAFGGLGAFLSVTTGIRLIDVDINLKRWEHIFAGASRILIGVVGALVIGLALDARFMDPTFGHSGAPGQGGNGNLDQHMAMKLIFAFIAGFSESLVPNVLRRGEQAAGAPDRQNTPDAAIVRDMKP